MTDTACMLEAGSSSVGTLNHFRDAASDVANASNSIVRARAWRKGGGKREEQKEEVRRGEGRKESTATGAAEMTERGMEKKEIGLEGGKAWNE